MAKGSKINRSELIRQALGTGLSTAKEVIEHVKKTHGVDVNDALVYNVKNLSRSKAAKRKPTPKPTPKPKALSSNFVPQAKALTKALTVGDIIVVKGLLERLGSASSVKELIDVLA